MVGLDHPKMAAVRKYFATDDDNDDDDDNNDDDERSRDRRITMTMLDPKHPVYNFLVEYYGLKGLKGPKRLARWSPGIGLFFWDDKNETKTKNGDEANTSGGDPSTDQRTFVHRVTSVEEYHERASRGCNRNTASAGTTDETAGTEVERAVFLEGARPDDLALTLYLQGAEYVAGDDGGDRAVVPAIHGGGPGVLYRPPRFYQSLDGGDPASPREGEATDAGSLSPPPGNNYHTKATSFLWYKSVLEQTMEHQPVLHCYGLHEWAMQYHPNGDAPPPPSGKYQAHLRPRVSQETINETVEREGLRCTHVDALRFFAPEAGPLNSHGAVLERGRQLELEQPACLHAHMDLLKIALRLKPYCDPSVLVDVLEIALEARSIDVGASPYDCSAYSWRKGTGRGRTTPAPTGTASDAERGGGSSPSPLSPVPVVPVETAEGRALYKDLQSELMGRAGVVRRKLLANYEAYGALAFATRQLEEASRNPADERFARAEPGGRSWRHNLIDRE